MPQPDLVTFQGTNIYTNDVHGLTLEKIECALEHYAINFPALVGYIATEREIRDILQHTTILFTCTLDSTHTRYCAVP